MDTFKDRLQKQFKKGKFLCIGLDTDPAKIPKHLPAGILDRMVAFNTAIIDETYDIVAAYKPNSAFYEAYGEAGAEALSRTIQYIRSKDPDIIIVLDAKRGDIGNTNDGYVKAAFVIDDADAITIHPYMGKEANLPFLTDDARGVFVLGKTSNPGSDEFQGEELNTGLPLYLKVASNVANSWNTAGNVGLVVGATYPLEMAYVRQAAPEVVILIPGIGAQGGDLEMAVRAGMDANRSGFLINNSRAVLYASQDTDFAQKAREVAFATHEAINAARLLDHIVPSTVEEVAKKILEETNAVLTGGHFVYTAGDHGAVYVNKDAIYVHPDKTESLCRMIAEKFRDYGIETVMGPEKGGIILSQYVAKHLWLLTGKMVAAVYAEKTPNDGFTLGRGYDAYVKGKNVLVVEDILNSGKTVTQVVTLTASHEGTVVGVGALCNRGNVTAEQVNAPVLFSTINVKLEKYPAAACPLCAANVPIDTKVGKGKEFLAAKEALAV